MLHLSKEKNATIEDEYIFETNDKQEEIIKKIGKESNQEINIIFESKEETNIMSDVLKQLTKVYIEDILKLET